MKRSHKFLIFFVLLTLIFSVACFAVNTAELNSIRNSTNEAVLNIAAVIKEKYPDVDSREIASILNEKTDTQQTDKLLKKYGIDKDVDWINLNSEKLSAKITAVNASLCILICLSFYIVFIIYCKRREKEAKQITDYVVQINKKNYNLEIEKNSEDEMSFLKNEIYKTTVMLKEQSENSKKDKENLKNSLSDISHQLKTPLTSVIVMLDTILEDEDMPQEIRTEFLNDIRRSANSISFLVQSILTLSKLDANSIVFKNKPESVSEIICECIQNTAVLAEIKSVEVTGGCSGDIVLKCDFRWLCEAVTNIVKNCIEHTDEGGYVKIEAEQNTMFTKIIVRDNGCGIEEKDLPHIFERFYKGRNSSDDSIGIGLALAKTIVEKSGGIISADSEINKGSVFTLVFFN